MTPTDQQPWRRHVFFLSGFDPRGGAHFHALYRSEALKQASVNEMVIEVGPRRRNEDGNSTWMINATSPDGSRCQTSYEFAKWDDIVRKNWPRGIFQQLLSFFQYTRMLDLGGIATTWKLSRKTLVALAYPLAVLGGGLGLSTLAGLGAATVLHWAGAGWPVAVALGLALFALGLWGTHTLEKKLNSLSLVRIFSFTGKHARAELPEFEARLDANAHQIEKKIRANNVDEILIVGFSVGTIRAASSLARALSALESDSHEADHCAQHPALSLLTLGHSIPMLGLLPQAANFRRELGVLALSKSLTWIDFSSPADVGSFALVDPVDTCKIDLSSGTKRNPVMRSPRFHTMFAPASYAAITREKLRLHMQYLMAGELPSDYDYFAITAGACTLAERYPDR